MGYLTPEQAQALARLGQMPAENDILQQEIARGLQLQQPGGYRHTSAVGGVLGGLGDVLRTGAGVMREVKARKGLGANQQQAGDLRAQFLARALQGPAAAPESPAAGMVPGLGDISQPTQEAKARALAATLQGDREAALAALSSGDPVLAKWAEAARADMARQGEAEERAGVRGDALRQHLDDRRFTAEEREKDRRAEEARFRATLGMKTAGEQSERAAQAQKTGQDLRKEMLGLPAIRSAQDVAVAYDKMKRSARLGSAAGDMAMIYGFMRMQDPGSTVREGEYANANNAKGVPEYVIAAYNKAVDGQLLTPKQREDFLGAATQMYEAQVTPARSLRQQYGGYAERAGLNPAEVLPDLGLGGDAALVPGTTGNQGNQPAGGVEERIQALKSQGVPAAEILKQLRAEGVQ